MDDFGGRAFGAALAATVLALAGILLARGAIPFTSDQAIPALMAIDIAEGTTAPVFYYGVEYGGALESWVLAVAYHLFGPSTEAYRGLMVLLLVGVVLALWRAAALAAGSRAGAAVGLCAAFAPAYLYYKVLTSDGAYASLTFFGATALMAVAHVERGTGEGRAAGPGLAALGFVLGVAFWIHLASLPYLVAGAAAIVSWVLRRRAGPRHVALGAAGFLLGSLPWWIRNLQTGFASLMLPEASVVSPDGLFTRFAQLLTESLPILLGPSSFRGPAVPAWATAILLAGVVAVIAVGIRRALRGAPGGEAFLSRLALVLVGASTAAFLAAGNTSPWEPRYLLPGLLGFVVLVGFTLADGLRRPGWRLVVSVLPLMFALASHLGAPRLRDFQRMTSDDPREPRILFAKPAEVLSAISAKGARSVYGSYWTVYRLVFHSSRGIAGSPFGRIAVNRMPEMSRSVDRDPSPAFVLDGDDLRDMDAWLAAGGYAAERTPAGGVVVFTGLPEKAIAELRAARGVPRL